VPEKGTYDKRLVVNAELISDVPGENNFVGEQKVYLLIDFSHACRFEIKGFGIL